MNYAELSAALISYTDNQDPAFAAEIPVFVRQTEQRVYNSVQFPSLRKNVTGFSTASNKYLACPNDFLAPYSMAVVTGVVNGNINTGSYEFLLNKDVNFIRQAYPTPNDTGVPKYYALFGAQTNDANELTFILGPTPNASLPIELHYYYYPESIVTAGTTWLGDNFDSVLLYGSLVEAYTFMKGEQDMMQLYDIKYKEALALLKNLGDGKQRGDTYYDGQVKLKVQ